MRVQLVDTDKRVYLSPHEFELYRQFAPRREALAAKIMGWVSPRVGKTAELRRQDFYNPDAPGVELYFCEIWEAKDTREVSADDGKHRFSWCPESLYEEIESYCEDEGIAPEDPLFDLDGDTLSKYLSELADELAKETGEEGWLSVTSHDFRVYFVTNSLRRLNIPESTVMEMGGWESRKAIAPYKDVLLPVDIQNELVDVDPHDYLEREVPEVDSLNAAVDRAGDAPAYEIETQAGLDEFEIDADD